MAILSICIALGLLIVSLIPFLKENGYEKPYFFVAGSAISALIGGGIVFLVFPKEDSAALSEWVILGSYCGITLWNLYYAKTMRRSFWKLMDEVFLRTILPTVVFLFERWTAVMLCCIGIVLFLYRKKNEFLQKRGVSFGCFMSLIGVCFALQGKSSILHWILVVIFIVTGIVTVLLVKNKAIEKPCVLFDLDGTLLDTENSIFQTYRHLFELYRTADEFTKEKQIEVLGPALDVMMKKYFPNKDPQECIEEFRVYQKKIAKDVVKPMPYTKELLDWLKKEGYVVGVVSTKMNATIMEHLGFFGFQSLISVVIGHDQVTVEKPNPQGIRKALALTNKSADCCIYVGDNPTDVGAGRNAGVFTVAYLSTIEKKDAIEKQRPNRCTQDLKDIQEMLEKEKHEWTISMM